MDLLPTLPVLDNRTLVDRIVDAGCHDSKAGAGGQAARQFQPQVSVMFPWAIGSRKELLATDCRENGIMFLICISYGIHCGSSGRRIV